MESRSFVYYSFVGFTHAHTHTLSLYLTRTHVSSIDRSINQSGNRPSILLLRRWFLVDISPTYFHVPSSSNTKNSFTYYFYQITYRPCTPSAPSSSLPSSSSPPQLPNTAPTSPQAPAPYHTTQPAPGPPTPSALALAPATSPSPQAVAQASQQLRAHFLRL